PHGQGGNSPGVVNGKDHPAVKNGDEVAIGFAQIEIRSAGLGIHRAKLGESQTAEHSDGAADYPDSDEECGCVENSGDVPGSEEDAGTDDSTGEQQYRVHQR